PRPPESRTRPAAPEDRNMECRVPPSPPCLGLTCSASRGCSIVSVAKPERRLSESVVVPDLLLVDLPVELVEATDVEHALPRDADSVVAFDHLNGRMALLLERFDHSIRHEVIRLDLALHLFLREAVLIRQDAGELRVEPILVQVDSHLRDEPVQDEAAVDDQILVRPGGHGSPCRCGLRYLIRSSRRSRTRTNGRCLDPFRSITRERPVNPWARPQAAHSAADSVEDPKAREAAPSHRATPPAAGRLHRCVDTSRRPHRSRRPSRSP